MTNKIYTWNTKKVGAKFVFSIEEITPRKTKNSKGQFADSKFITSGNFSTRTKASATAKKWVKFFKAKQDLNKKVNFSFKQ